MKVLVAKNYQELSQRAATFLLNHVALEPRSVFGLATGSTPEGMYAEIIRATKNLSYDFFHCKTFNLDEYVGLHPDHEQSYHTYMSKKFFEHIRIQKENIFIPEGHKNNLEKQCETYEKHMQRHPIDVQVLGLGSNGHIGFNEPGSACTSRTRVVDLTPATIRANARFFDAKQSVPKKAITMGIATIMQAKKIVIIANGEHKARAVKQMIEGKISTACPASILQKHPDVTAIVDRGAAKLLKNDYSDHKNGWTDVRILNKNVLPQYKNVLAISPHPDDSAVSSGATIRALFEQNNVTIMAMTSGYRAAIPGADKQQRIVARKKEAVAEAKKLQAQLLFPEFHFYDQGRKKWKQDLKKFGTLWKSINPSVVILPHQYDEHPTHKYSTMLVEEYIKQEKIKQIELWYYESVWSQHLLTHISQVFCYNEELHDIKNSAINCHTSQVKRIPLVEITQNLSRFRALTIPEQKFVTYGQEPINLSSFVEAYHVEKR